MTDQYHNQQRYENELLPIGYKPWQCALMVIACFTAFSSLAYLFGGMV